MRSRDTALAALTVAGALACAGCGPGKSVAGPAAGRQGSSANDVKVIRDWSQALTAGKVDKAASYFALPAIVQNGTPPIRITDRRQVRAFNALLPCGANLIETVRSGAYTEATFRLTQRPGGDCRSGTGATAATAFLIRGGKIVEWRRLPGGGGQPQPAPSPAPSPQSPNPPAPPNQGPTI